MNAMNDLGSLADLPTEYVEALASHNLVPLWPSLRGVLPPTKPRPIISRLQQASAQVLRDPDLLNKLRNAGYEVEPSIGDDFGAELRADIDRWVRVIRDAKIPRE